MTDKALNLLGLARRAGKIAVGFEDAAAAAREGRAMLLLAARDISEKTYKNLTYEAGRAEIPVGRLKADMAETGHACGVKAGVLAVTDRGFARAIQNAIEQMSQEKEDTAYDD